MHQVLYIVQLPNEEGDMHIIQHVVRYDMPCDPNLVSSTFYNKMLDNVGMAVPKIIQTRCSTYEVDDSIQ